MELGGEILDEFDQEVDHWRARPEPPLNFLKRSAEHSSVSLPSALRRLSVSLAQPESCERGCEDERVE